MIIKNADVYTQDNVFVKGDVVVDNGTFTKVLEAPDYVDNEVVDATGLKMIPGLVDIHFHGCKGADMCDGTKEALDIISRYEASVGVTSICPATMTIAKEELVEKAARLTSSCFSYDQLCDYYYYNRYSTYHQSWCSKY